MKEIFSLKISSLSIAIELLAAKAVDEKVITNDSRNSTVVVLSTSRYDLTIVVLNLMKSNDRVIWQISFSISNSMYDIVYFSDFLALLSVYVSTFELIERSCNEVMINSLWVFNVVEGLLWVGVRFCCWACEWWRGDRESQRLS